MSRYLQTSEASYVWCKHHHHLCNSLRIQKRLCTKGNSRFTVFACRWTWDLRYVNFVLLLCKHWLMVIWGIETLLCVGIVGVDGIWECAVLCVVVCLHDSEEQPHYYCYCHLWISGSTSTSRHLHCISFSVHLWWALAHVRLRSWWVWHPSLALMQSRVTRVEVQLSTSTIFKLDRFFLPISLIL